MDNYAWQKNEAVTKRMYYAERVFTSTTLAATFWTAANMVLVRNNYFASMARARIMPTWRNYFLFNAVAIGMLLAPLTKEEIATQWRKRVVMGKYLYTLYHLQSPEELAAEFAADAADAAAKALEEE